MGGGKFDTVTHKAELVLAFITLEHSGDKKYNLPSMICVDTLGGRHFVCMEILIM